MPRHWYMIIGFAVVLVATVILIAAAIFILNKDTSLFSFAPEPTRPPPPAPVPVEPRPAPEILVYKGGTEEDPSLVVSWKNLPKDTAKINIYRNGACALTTWELWKIINVAGLTDAGIIEIVLKLSEANCDYSYRTETISQYGQSSWNSDQSPADPDLPPDLTIPTSTPASVEDPPPPPAPPPPSPPPTPSSTASSTPPATPSSTPTSTPSSTVPSTPTSTPSSTPSSSQNTYYTPQSTVSGYDNPPSGEFWVQHVHQYIEIGWQNLPAGTTGIVVSRSTSPSGPWAVLIEQQNVDAQGPYVFRIGDDTLTTVQYYVMDALDGTNTLSTYGPVLLEPFGT